MQRKIKVCIIVSNPFTEAYIKGKFSNDPFIIVAENPFQKVDAFILQKTF